MRSPLHFLSCGISLIHIFLANLRQGSGKRGTAAPPRADKPSLSCARVAPGIHRGRDPVWCPSHIRCLAPCRGSWRRAAPNCGAPPRMRFLAAASSRRRRKKRKEEKALYRAIGLRSLFLSCQPSAINSNTDRCARSFRLCVSLT